MRRAGIALALLAIGFVPVLAGLAFRAASSSDSRRPTGAGTAPNRYLGSEPPRGIHMPTFGLRDYRGRLVTGNGLRGKVTLIAFLDTDCTTQCPIVATAIGSGRAT